MPDAVHQTPSVSERRALLAQGQDSRQDSGHNRGHESASPINTEFLYYAVRSLPQCVMSARSPRTSHPYVTVCSGGCMETRRPIMERRMWFRLRRFQRGPANRTMLLTLVGRTLKIPNTLRIGSMLASESGQAKMKLVTDQHQRRILLLRIMYLPYDDSKRLQHRHDVEWHLNGTRPVCS